MYVYFDACSSFVTTQFGFSYQIDLSGLNLSY